MMAAALSAGESANMVRWTPKRPNFFETYYLKWQDLRTVTAGWVRYTICKSARNNSEAAVWCAFIDGKDPSRNVLLKECFPFTSVHCARERFSLTIGDSGINHRRAWGSLEKGGRRLAWNVETTTEELICRHVPWPFHRGILPPTKFVAPFCWSRLSGAISVDGETLLLDRVPAHQGHFWGTKQVASWTWGNCGSFREDSEFGFEGISGRVSLGRFKPPPLNSFAFYWEGRCLRSNSLGRVLLNRSRNDLEHWEFEATAGKFVFRGDIRSRSEDMILYRHVDPDGDSRYSHNNFCADACIRLFRNGKEIKKFTAERSAAFEVAGPERDPRVSQVISL
jgi:hypothetical protein